MAFKLGDKRSTTVQVTDKMIHQFAEMSGDFNPIHVDDEYAKNTRFGKRIAHGMISGALISRTLATELGRGGIYLAQTLKFLKPVFIDDTITVELEVKAIRESSGIAAIDTVVRNQHGDIVVKGEATIMKGDHL